MAEVIPLPLVLAVAKELRTAANEKSKERLSKRFLKFARNACCVMYAFQQEYGVENPAAGIIMLDNARACLILARYVYELDWLKMQKSASLLNRLVYLPKRVVLTFRSARKQTGSVPDNIFEQYGLALPPKGDKEYAQNIERTYTGLVNLGLIQVQIVKDAKIFVEDKLKDHDISTSTPRRFLGIDEAIESLQRASKHLVEYRKLHDAAGTLEDYQRLYKKWGGTPQNLMMAKPADRGTIENAFLAVQHIVTSTVDDITNAPIFRSLTS